MNSYLFLTIMGMVIVLASAIFWGFWLLREIREIEEVTVRHSKEIWALQDSKPGYNDLKALSLRITKLQQYFDLENVFNGEENILRKKARGGHD